MKGKLIVIEGTDCSGKETQSKLLLKYMEEKGMKVCSFSFPMYETPTGKIVGGSYLGKESIGASLFKEGAVNVEPKVASLYYAADRRYNIDKINKKLEEGYHVILDRYVYSNMAHQGGKIQDTDQRLNMYAWLDVLEFKLLELPKPDIAIFLHMPVEYTYELRKNRNELDELEKDDNHLKLAEKAYIELAQNYNWVTIECVTDRLKTFEEISKEVIENVIAKL
jgi:dTMP kinase